MVMLRERLHNTHDISMRGTASSESQVGEAASTLSNTHLRCVSDAAPKREGEAGKEGGADPYQLKYQEADHQKQKTKTEKERQEADH